MRNHEFTQAEKHREAVAQAMEHCDARGVPDDSLIRGLADIHLACNEIPPLNYLMAEMWPSSQALMQ